MKHPDPLAHLEVALEDLSAAGLLRTTPSARGEGEALPSFCSNDYLGLAALPVPSGAAGAGASRLIAGEREEHARLEAAVASWLGTPSALLFTSGYAANVGAVSALARPGDLLVSDSLNHASIIDGARLSGATVAVVPHADVRAVSAALDRPCEGRRWVVTESYFSMDADSPDLAALRRVCDDAGAALYVDEAHALGVLGPDGRGLCAEAGVRPDVLVGTFGKSFGASGAFVAGSPTLRAWLWNRARSFVFSTGTSPAVAEAARANLARSVADPTLRARAVASAERLRSGLRRLGVSLMGHGPIVPWLVGESAEATRLAAAIRERGFHVVAVRPPTVPQGQARIRLAVTAAHTPEQIDALVEVIREVACLRSSS